MYTHTIQYQGPVVSTNYSISNSSVTPAGLKALFVSYGLVKGDHKKPNNFSFEKHQYVYEHGSVRSLRTDTFRTYDEGTDGVLSTDAPNGVIGPHPSAYQEQLVDRCWEKVYELIRGKNNLVVDALEGGQTLRMLRNTLNLKKFVGEFLTEFARPRKRGSTSNQKRLDYITSKWLEYRYGWTPLVYSIYDAMDTLGRKHVQDGLTPFKERAGLTRVDSTVTGRGTISDPLVVTHEKVSARCQVVGRFRLSPETQIYDWTSLNPLRWAYELATLSFVVDWVVNVSQQLSLWENYYLFNSRFVDGATTHSYKIMRNRSKAGISNQPILYWPNGDVVPWQDIPRGISSESSFVETACHRRVTASIPAPGGLRVNVSFGSKRQLDAAALLHTMVARRLR
jgi:hypothetical protein